MNDGDGTFRPVLTHGGFGESFNVAAGDIDGDTKTDIVVTEGGAETVSVLLHR